MFSMVVTLEVSHCETSPLKAVAEWNIACVVVTLEVSHCETSLLKIVAERNMWIMVVTLEVSHCETSPLKAVASLNMACMVVALEVSHVEMAPYFEVAVVESESHSSTAPDRVESSKLDGQLAEPLLPENMSVVVIDERFQHRSWLNSEAE